MGKIVRKQLWAERNILLVGILMLFISMFFIINIQLSRYSSEKCFMDAFCWVSYNMPTNIYPVSLFITIVLTREEFALNKVLRWKKQQLLWRHLTVKVAWISMVCSFAVFGITCILGGMISQNFCNWNQPGTLCVHVLNTTLENVNYIGIMLVYFFCVLFGMYFVGILPILSFWMCKSYIPGIMLAIFICVGGNEITQNYNGKRGVFYNNLLDGIDIRYQFLIPVIVSTFAVIIGYRYRRREFLDGVK